VFNISTFIDDKINHIESDIEKIQVKPNMYISYSGERGALHLFKEIVNNSIDEMINPYSPCDKAIITLDITNNEITVRDNGRGIPFEDMDKACTKLQSGSKFVRATSLGSAGENGCGLTVTNALSDYFILSTRRDGKKIELLYNNGVLIDKKETKDSDHGLEVKFKPSQNFLGKCKFSADDIKSWLNDVQYMLLDKNKVKLSIIEKGKEIFNGVYKNKDGMSTVLDNIIGDKLVSKNIHLFNSTTLKEEVNAYEDGKMEKKMVHRYLGIEVAFNFDENFSDLNMKSFCNFVSTIDNGEHADAVKNAIQQFLAKETKKILTDKEAKKIDITYNDIASGLCIALYLSTDYQVHFASQTKEKVSNKDLFEPIKRILLEQLKDFFKRNPAILKTVTAHIKKTAKLRLAMMSAKKVVLKDELRGFKDYGKKNFLPANNKGKNDYREIIVVEGDSAGGSMGMGRFDNATQAIYGARGVPMNVHDASLNDVLSNSILREFSSILGCNIGDKFNMDNLYYQKIIIGADADIDGMRICAGWILFFYTFYRPIIEVGKLYKLITPLYKIKHPKKKFLLSRKELNDLYKENVRVKVTLIHPSGKKLSKSELDDFMDINIEYDKALDDMADNTGIHFSILENLALHWLEFDMDFKALKKVLKKVYKEIELDNNILAIIVDNNRYRMTLDEELFNNIEELKRYLALNKSPVYDLELDDKTYHDLTISQIMDKIDKLSPEIITRFKGIGELNPDEVRETSMNPANRRLQRITIEDIEGTDSIFRVLFGSSANKVIDEARKKMMLGFKINKEDIDN